METLKIVLIGVVGGWRQPSLPHTMQETGCGGRAAALHKLPNPPLISQIGSEQTPLSNPPMF